MLFKRKTVSAKLVEDADSQENFSLTAPGDNLSSGAMLTSADGKLGSAKEQISSASFWPRFKAACIDHLILFLTLFLPGLVISSAIVYEAISSYRKEFYTENMWIVSLFLICIGFFYVSPLVYYAWFESSSLQATPGKFLSGLKVVDLKTGKGVGLARALWKSLVQFLLLIIIGVFASILAGVFFSSEDIFSASYKLWFTLFLIVEAGLAVLLMCRPAFEVRGAKLTLLDLVTGRTVVPASRLEAEQLKSFEIASGQKSWQSTALKVLGIVWLVFEILAVSMLLLFMVDYALFAIPVYMLLRVLFRKSISKYFPKVIYYGTPILMSLFLLTAFVMSVDFHYGLYNHVKSSMVLLDKGLEAEKKGDVRKAEAIYRQVREQKNLDSGTLIMSLGYIRFILGSDNPYEDYYFDRVLVLSRENTTTHLGKAKGLADWGQWKRASKEMRLAIAEEADRDKKVELENELSKIEKELANENHKDG